MIEIGNCTILHGDNLEILRLLPDCSVHTCVTDPPYGLGFMGKKWDTFAPGVAERRIIPKSGLSDNPNLKGRTRAPASSPSAVEYDRSLGGQRAFQAWNEVWAREVFRVLKPGAHLLVCGAPRSFHRMISGVEDAGFEIRDCLMWLFGQGFPKSHNLKGDWQGWGTALKPGWEPIVVARKPLVGTVAANVAAHGTGAMNIDGCRIEGGSKNSGETALGRWPANVLHDGSDEVLGCFPDAPGQLADAKTSGENKTRSIYGKMRYGEASADIDNEGAVGFKMKPGARRGDTGSAARFFYVAKASKKDRNDGCEGLPLKPSGMVSNTSGQHITRCDGNAPGPSANSHPTVKPTALMRYLVRLVTPPGGTVLDPFFGSGSTGKACALEGFACIGIEREADYVAIAQARVQHAYDKLNLSKTS